MQYLKVEAITIHHLGKNMQTKNKQKFETFYYFKNIEDFQNFLRTKEWKSGELDYITVGDRVYTMHEYDSDGQNMSWANKKHNELIDCDTSNRYGSTGFTDAKLYLFEDYGFLRDDIHYQE